MKVSKNLDFRYYQSIRFTSTQQTQPLETNKWRYIPAILQHPTTITGELCILGLMVSSGSCRYMSVSLESTRFDEIWAF